MKLSAKSLLFAELLILIVGIGIYLVRSLHYAYTLNSILDEGAYLYKGYLFAQGVYKPFQDYGPWTNKAPLAFLIPGYIQLWFGPGLLVGRYFSIFAGVLMLVGLWVAARRLGGKVWAALIVCIMALSTSVSDYSQGTSQVLVACILVWTFALILGEDRPLWQLVFGSILSVMAVLTRQNMAPIIPLVVLFIFWQHGKKAGWWALFASTLVFVLIHLLYWPNIMQIWSPWLPRSLTSVLGSFQVSGSRGPGLVIEFTDRLNAFSRGIQSHFVVLGSWLAIMLMWPKKNDWKSDSLFRASIFLIVVYAILLILHGWASLYMEYCNYCFPIYLSFFNVAGLLITVLLFSSQLQFSSFGKVTLTVILIVFVGFLGLSFYDRIGDWLLANIQLPRLNRFLSGGALFPGVPLGGLLTDRFAISTVVQRRYASFGAGILAAVLFISILWISYQFLVRKEFKETYPFMYSLLIGFILLGTFSPILLNKIKIPSGRQACVPNLLASYEEAGRTLGELIPAQSRVYWYASGDHLALLLYTKDLKIFPAQLNGGNNYMLSGQTEQIARLGYWNPELEQEWRQSAEYFLIWSPARGEDLPYRTSALHTDLHAYLNTEEFERIKFSPRRLLQCGQNMVVYRRRP